MNNLKSPKPHVPVNDFYNIVGITGQLLSVENRVA